MGVGVTVGCPYIPSVLDPYHVVLVNHRWRVALLKRVPEPSLEAIQKDEGLHVMGTSLRPGGYRHVSKTWRGTGTQGRNTHESQAEDGHRPRGGLQGGAWPVQWSPRQHAG